MLGDADHQLVNALALAGILAVAFGRRRMSDLRVLRISRVVAHLDRAEAFYCDGLGFQRVGAGSDNQGRPGGRAVVTVAIRRVSRS